LKTHKIRRKYRDKKKNFLQAENYIDYLQQQFNNFIKETTQDRQCLELKRSFEQYELDQTIYSTEIKNKRLTLIERFISIDLINYMLHKDIKVLKNLLENSEKKQAQNIITQLLSNLAKFKFSNLLHDMIDLINSYQPDIYSLHTSEKIPILDYLIQINNIDLLEAILEKNPTIQNEYNQFPLDYIIQQKEDDLIEQILSLPGVILSPYTHENKLTNALTLKTLANEREWLSDAIRDSNINMIKNLLDCNINIDLNAEEEETGKTPLMVAVFWDDDIAALLIKHGAQINITSSIDGTTPLLLAVENNNITMVRLLLNEGADPNQANPLNGITPLHMATMNNNLSLIKLLIQAKADSNLKDFSNKKPKHYINPNQFEIAVFFEKLKISAQKNQTQETAVLYNFFSANMHKPKLLNENSVSRKCVLI
ncbi:MAG: ankyrin repeat domain-containing protein, partial [Legionella longbeachae]|nr:ankyrin repeat domain-containing protein [Legionella longbeachae]